MKEYCWNCKETGHNIHQCSENRQSTSKVSNKMLLQKEKPSNKNNKTKGKCSRYLQEGHNRRTCTSTNDLQQATAKCPYCKGHHGFISNNFSLCPMRLTHWTYKRRTEKPDSIGCQLMFQMQYSHTHIPNVVQLLPYPRHYTTYIALFLMSHVIYPTSNIYMLSHTSLTNSDSLYCHVFNTC